MSFGARATIRLEALNNNFELLASLVPGCRVMAAVKANAYGHGIVRVSQALTRSDAFAVARLSEAEELRAAGINQGIVLMGGVIDADDLARAKDLGCDLVVHHAEQISLLEQSSPPGAGFKVWLKVDTGMHRLGVDPADAAIAVDRLSAAAAVAELGLMTHLANADDTNDPMSSRQIERFMALLEGFGGDVSVANSAALLGWTDAVRQVAAKSGSTWIRPGISLYGISPLQGRSAAELGLQPAMDFETTLLSVKPVKAGERVGYGGHWTADHDTVIGVAAAGYGDGYSRFLPSGTPVLVAGRRVPLAGVISMDLLAVDLGPGARDRVGAPVRLWGEGLPVEEVAGYAATTAYPLVTGVQDRARQP